MLKDYEEYLVRIRDNLIRCGVSLPVKRDYTYEELFNLGENISDILWFYGILAVVNSRARLMGFNWSLDRTLKGKLRSMFYDEYLEGKRSYDEISVEKFLEKKYGSQRVSEGYDESDDEDDQEESGYDPPEQDVPVSSELKSSGSVSTAGMLAMFITQNNVNTSSDEDENDDLENFNGGEVGDMYSGVQFDENDFPSDEEDEDDPEDVGGTFLDDEEERELSEMDGTFLEDEEEYEEGIPSFNEDDFPSEPEDEEDEEGEEDLSEGSWLSDENEEDDSDDNGWFDGGESEVEFSEDDFPDESDDEDNDDEVEFSDDDFPDESDEDEEDEEDEDIEFSDDDFPGFGDIDEEDEEDEEPTFKNAQSSNISQSSGNPSATPRPVKRQMTQMEKDIKSVEDASRILSTGVSKSKNVLKGILKGMIPKN